MRTRPADIKGTEICLSFISLYHVSALYLDPNSSEKKALMRLQTQILTVRRLAYDSCVPVETDTSGRAPRPRSPLQGRHCSRERASWSVTSATSTHPARRRWRTGPPQQRVSAYRPPRDLPLKILR